MTAPKKTETEVEIPYLTDGRIDMAEWTRRLDAEEARLREVCGLDIPADPNDLPDPWIG